MAKMLPHYCSICTKRPPHAFKSAKKASKTFLRNFPTLAVVQDMEEGSELQGLRGQCLVTGSAGGVLFNAKRGQSLLNWIEVTLKLKTRPPFNDYVKKLMEAGRRMEPIIAQYNWNGLYREYAAVFGEAEAKENLMWIHPGMAMQAIQEKDDDLTFHIGATPDGLVVLYDGEHFRLFCVEIKYYASKTEIPDDIPEDYIAQIVLQLMTTGTNVCLFLSRVGERESETFYEWRVLVLRPTHQVPFRQKINEIGNLVARQRSLQSEDKPFNYPKRYQNEKDELRRIGDEMEVARGSTFPELLRALLESAPQALLIK